MLQMQVDPENKYLPMKKFCLILLISFFLPLMTPAQKQQGSSELTPLSESELQKLAEIPAYHVATGDQISTLPASVDNTTQPYFRPLFNQSGLECGQAASIGLNFTYEINLARNLPANTTQNQYATHFTYNFINGGSDAGVSYFETWEIVKRCGTPTSADYGGLATGGAARWMTGYDKYYNAMHNRISDVYSITAEDSDGLEVLKNWIYNHSNTSTAGGLANIYIQYKTPDTQLAAGTPEAGKWVITTWGGSPNHAVTLVGYNDSIRYDYNNDGQYTNNIDINGDGSINMKDWEIGGFKLANTYGGINNWGNQGFSYVMYKTFADNLGSGGIWNHSAHIVKVKQDVTPKLTFRITLKHTSRNKLKIMAGVSQNQSAAEPDALLNLPVFDYQGGDKYMLGGVTEADKTIEFGIDATPLLSEIETGQPAKFFLMVSENDPTALATGQIISFSIVDYNGSTTTIPCSVSNVPIVENGLTVLSINHTPSQNKPIITTDFLPEAKLYEPYSFQLNATGGTTAYKWKFLCDYTESQTLATFPTVTAQQLAISNTSSGFAEVNLPFEFPFYGKKYSKLYAHVDGYLMFQPDLMPWTFIIYEKTFFRNTHNISPYMAKPLTLFPSEGDGIWYESNQNYAIFRWKSGMYGSGPSTDLNYAAKIFPDGKIEFYYGNIVSNDWVKWNAGISNGDGINYRFCAITDSLTQPAPGTMISFAAPVFPTEMTLSEEGTFSGTPMNTYNNVPIRFYAEDNNNLYNKRTLTFSTKGIIIEYTVSSGGDSIIEYGETTQLSAKLTNIGSSALHDVNLNLSINDPFVSLIDSTQYIGLLNPGQTVTVNNALSFLVSDFIPDAYIITTTSQAVATEDFFTRILPLTAYSPVLGISAISILDGNNNILNPGESGTLNITVKNTGGAAASGINALLSTIDPLISVLQANDTIALLDPGNSQNIVFQISVSPSCPSGHIALAALNLSADVNYSIADSAYFTIGTVAEDFETGDFTKYPWQSGGNASWIVTTTLPYEGNFCAASPALADNQQSSMFAVMNVLSASEISFYRKVSSEINYDFLTFYIDGIEQSKWSGEVPWGKVTYAVSAGSHTFAWRYYKDVNTVAGGDKAWVDYIIWPPYDDLLLIANAGPDDFICSPIPYELQATVINALNILWTSSGNGYFDDNSMVNTFYHPGNGDLINGSVVLTLSASNATAQPVSDNVILSVYQSPQAWAGPDASICSGNTFTVTGATASNQQIQWSTSGDGTFSNNIILSPVYTPGTADISNGYVSLTLTSFGSVQCGDANDVLQLTIHPAVNVFAGTDQSIPYGTSTQLDGDASGGTSNLNISWEPVDKLVYAGVIDPFTLNLTNSVEFTLLVTDQATLCNAQDAVFVNVTGSPLSVNASALPEHICNGDSSQLNAIAGGGTGNYSYSWSSDPAGFTSQLANPVVNPGSTTTYYVNVSDGASNQQTSITVTVDLIAIPPSQPSGPASVNVALTPTTAYNTDGSSNSNGYIWHLTPQEAGSVSSTGTNCSVQWSPAFSGTAALSVAGVNICGTGGYSQALSIAASPFIGMDKNNPYSFLEVWPNPGNGTFFISSSFQGRCRLFVSNQQGKIVHEADFQNLNEPFKLDLNSCTPGLYILTIENGISRQSKRIIVAK